MFFCRATFHSTAFVVAPGNNNNLLETMTNYFDRVLHGFGKKLALHLNKEMANEKACRAQ
jgi:hypothetical protein